MTMAAVDVEELTSRRAATHWLFSRLVGVRGVEIPETALFDDEGVLSRWLYSTSEAPSTTTPTMTTTTQKLKPKAVPLSLARQGRVGDVVVRSRDVLELSLLKLEAHLQDLAHTRSRPLQRQQDEPHATSSAVAVAILYNDVASVALDEAALDTTVRSLCARQRAMTALEPDLSVPRRYADGRIVLQAAVAPVDRCATLPLAIDAVTIVSRFHADYDHVDGVREGFRHDVLPATPLPTGDNDDEEGERWRRGVRAIDWSVAFASAEAQCRAVLRHLRTCHASVVRSLTLEFACVNRELVLTCAHRVESTPRTPRAQRCHAAIATDNTATSATSEVFVPPSHRPRPRSSKFRVCRECRTPVDVDLARELLQQQTLVRDVLAKYQATSACHVAAEARCHAATDRVVDREAQIVALETELLRLREQLTAETTRTRMAVEHTHALTQQVAQAEARAIDVETLAHETEAQLQALQRQQSQQETHVDERVAHQQRDWAAQDAARIRDLERVQGDVTRLQTQCELLQTELEEARATNDELRFQWVFVTRKLTDVGDAGVLPPKRIAGGYSSYPTPTAANVALVVKWIVDYEARRTVLDAQRHRGSSGIGGSPGKPVKRRLQMKLELLRLLGSASRRSSRSPSPSRRKSSQSPQRTRSSTSCHAATDKDTAGGTTRTSTLVHESGHRPDQPRQAQQCLPGFPESSEDV